MAEETLAQDSGLDSNSSTGLGSGDSNSGGTNGDVQRYETADTGEAQTETVSSQAGDDYSDLYDPEDKPAEEAQPGAGEKQPETQENPVIAEALSLSPYITKPEQLKDAVAASTEIWDVHDGKADAGEFLDKFRTSGKPEAFKRILGQVKSYLNWAEQNGLMPKEGEVEDPAVAALRGEVVQMRTAEQKRQDEAKEAAKQASVNKGIESMHSFVAGKVKDDILDGDPNLSNAIFAKLDEMKVDPELLVKDYPAYEKQVEKALREIKKDTLDRTKRINANIMKRRSIIAKTSPASPGNNNVRRDATGKFAGGLPERSAFPEGAEGLWQWQEAYATATALMKPE